MHELLHLPGVLASERVGAFDHPIALEQPLLLVHLVEEEAARSGGEQLMGLGGVWVHMRCVRRVNDEQQPALLCHFVREEDRVAH